MAIQNISDTQFDSEVAQADVPVLVDFWAPWCGPCKLLAPVLAQYAEKAGGRVKVVKVNVDENQEYAARLGVRGIPTIVAYEGGKEKQRVTGAVSLARLEAAFPIPA